MIAINVTTDAAKMAKRLGLMKRQIPFVTSRALNGSVLIAKEKVRVEIGRRMDKPTNYTRNAVFMKYSTKTNLEAQVKLKDVLQSGSRLSAAQRLGHLFAEGPTRNFTGFEGWLLSGGYIKAGEYIAPTEHARKDGYGNMSKGQFVQIMSQLKVGIDAYAFKSDSNRSKAKRRRNRIFWSTGVGRMKNFSRGIWIDDGREIKKIMTVIKRPRYRVIVPIQQLTAEVVQKNFGQKFAIEARKVLSEG